MSDLVTLHEEIVDRLEGKTALRGVTILSLDALTYWKDLENALALVRGVAVAVGNPSGTNAGRDVPGGQFDGTIRVYVFENERINRERTLAATVADEAARLALSGVTLGNRVRQTDNGLDYFLHTSPESVAANWGEVMPATEITQRVIRSIHHFKPSGYQVLVCSAFEPGPIDAIHDFEIRFSIRIGLDPTAVP